METNSKIDFGERTCDLYLGWEVKTYNVGVMEQRREQLGYDSENNCVSRVRIDNIPPLGPYASKYLL